MMFYSDALAPQPAEHEPAAGWMGTDERAVFGLNVKAARTKAGLTQQQLADKVGIKQSFLSRIEAGKVDMTFDTMRRVATELGTEVQKLLIKDHT